MASPVSSTATGPHTGRMGVGRCLTTGVSLDDLTLAVSASPPPSRFRLASKICTGKAERCLSSEPGPKHHVIGWQLAQISHEKGGVVEIVESVHHGKAPRTKGWEG